MVHDYHEIATALGKDNAEFAGTTVLLVGSEGFLGQLFQRYFVFLNSEVIHPPVRVVCMDNQPRRDPLPPQFSYVQWDITRPVAPVLSFDWVINLAGLASPKAYSTYPLETVRVSVQGTDNLLALARDVKARAYLGFSSSEIYGDPTVVPTPESYLGGVEPHCERGCYDHGKLMLENLCYIYHTRHGVNTKLVRPFNVLGYMANDGRVVPGHCAKLVAGQRLTVYAPGIQTRTFCWFTDFVAGCVKVLLHGDNRPFNLGNDRNEIGMLDLARKLEAIAGKRDIIDVVHPTKVYSTEPMRRCPDISRARSLGYEPQVQLDEALERFWAYAREAYRS